MQVADHKAHLLLGVWVETLRAQTIWCQLTYGQRNTLDDLAEPVLTYALGHPDAEYPYPLPTLSRPRAALSSLGALRTYGLLDGRRLSPLGVSVTYFRPNSPWRTR